MTRRRARPSSRAAAALVVAAVALVLAPAGTPSANAAAAAPTYTFPVVARKGGRISYAHVHHDYPATDVFAPCGSAVVAPTAGVVSETNEVDRWRAATDVPADRGGLSVTVVGDDGVRYYGSHLVALAPGVAAGLRVVAGTRLGSVGQTGNAKGTGCHLHFGISPPCGVGDWEVRRGVLYPWPYLDAWRAGRSRSPVAAVAAWRTAHGCRAVA